MHKVDCPNNTLMNINHRYLTVQKSGKYCLTYHFVLAHVIPAATVPEEFENYECAENEVKLICPLYDISTGTFKGIKTILAWIFVKGDENETFFNYGYTEE